MESDLKRNWFAIALVVLVLVGTGAAVTQIVGNKPTLTIQTTTSLQDSGLLDLLKPAFEAKYRCTMRWVAVGTGQALTNAGNGLGDVCLVHSASLEMAFINHTNPDQTDQVMGITYAGQGIFRANFAYNYFVIVGPATDPLDISNSTKYPTALNSTQMFKLIYAAGQGGSPSGVKFVSRGDNSGTYTKEVSIWKAIKDWNTTVGSTSPYGWLKNVGLDSWYIQTGQGMAPTLTIANQKSAYVMTDYGTWLKMRNTLANLKVVSDLKLNDLKNTYSVIAVDPMLHPNANFDLAKKFIYFMCQDAQNVIGNYTISGELVFYKYANYAGTSPTGSSLDDVYTGTFGANLANASYYPISNNP